MKVLDSSNSMDAKHWSNYGIVMASHITHFCLISIILYFEIEDWGGEVGGHCLCRYCHVQPCKYLSIYLFLKESLFVIYCHKGFKYNSKVTIVKLLSCGIFQTNSYFYMKTFKILSYLIISDPTWKFSLMDLL